MMAMQGVAIGRLAGSKGLSVVFGLGANPELPIWCQLQHYIWFGFPFLFYWLACPSCCYCCRRRRRQGKGFCSTCCCMIPLTLLLWLLAHAAALAVHGLSLATGGQPTWLWMVQEKPQKMLALDAATGEERWALDMRPLKRRACAGDEEYLMARLPAAIAQRSDHVCIPDSWAQGVIDGDGTAFLGFADGRLFAVRDENGDGRIGGQEISEHDFGHAFQASQGLAPGILAVVPCGGGLWVWRKEP